MLSSSVLAILQACRLAYNEAVSILYSENLLQFRIRDAMKFMDEVGSDRLGAIQSVVLHGSGVDSYMLALETMLQRMPGLQVLHIRRRNPSYLDHASWKRAAKQIRDQLADFPALRELHLKTMEISGMSTPDKERKRQMLKVDRMLIDFVANKHSGKEEQSEDEEK